MERMERMEADGGRKMKDIVVTEDSPRLVLKMAESQVFLKDVPSAYSSLIPLAEHLVERIESLTKAATARHDIPSTTSVLTIISDQFLLRRDPQITRGSFHDADRILLLHSRISVIARSLLTLLRSTERDDAAKLAEKTAEARIKELVENARGCYGHVVKGGTGIERMECAEQVVGYLEVGVGRVVEDLAGSLPTGVVGAARAFVAPSVKRWVVDTFTDLQVKVLDAIEAPELRMRRRQANRNVDAVLRIFEEQAEMLLHIERDLHRLINL
ncbi:hypothetical protein HDU67_004695 [Dinochytrium kinnereticum]|nr:hypothetical protein HDU67_004695 [Dinochytrium kinnereticum]